MFLQVDERPGLILPLPLVKRLHSVETRICSIPRKRRGGGRRGKGRREGWEEGRRGGGEEGRRREGEEEGRGGRNGRGGDEMER